MTENTAIDTDFRVFSYLKAQRIKVETESSLKNWNVVGRNHITRLKRLSEAPSNFCFNQIATRNTVAGTFFRDFGYSGPSGIKIESVSSVLNRKSTVQGRAIHSERLAKLGPDLIWSCG